MRTALAILLSGCLLASCVTCTEIGCGSGASWSASAPSAVDFHGATVHACRNDVCVSGTFPTSGSGNTIALLPDVASPVEIGGSAAAIGTSFQVDVTGAFDALRDGDRYRIEIRDATGSLVLSLPETTATYDIRQPNGPQCGPTCRQTTLR